MKDRIDFGMVGALLRKQRQEWVASFKKGNFNAVGFVFRVVLIVALVAVFVVFFGNFLDIYLDVMTGGAPHPQERLYEVLSMAYTLILIALIISAVAQINRALFSSDDMRIMSALPVGANTLYISKLITIYFGQFAVTAVCVLAVNLTAAAHLAQSTWYYVATALACILMPLLTLGIASVIALPVHAVKLFLKERFVLSFIFIVVVMAALLLAYAWVLQGVKELLFGDDLRYFFNERIMNGIARAVGALYPANLIAGLFVSRGRLRCALILLAVLAVCVALSAVFIRLILTRALRAGNSGTTSVHMRKRKFKGSRSPMAALIKKEFLTIFRTTDYAFSYFAVALVVPLMVFFCMSIGSSLAERLVAVDCNLELAIFLTLLFGSLSNVFCTTNISRDGKMFYSVKAMPVSPYTVIFSKVILCLIVTVLSQLLSAAVLAATGYVSVPVALFLLLVGVLFGFAQICIATRIDFDHAKFSSEPDGEIKESGNTVSIIMVAGLAASLLVGGAVVLARMMFALRGLAEAYAWVTFAVAGVIALIAAAAGLALLMYRLKSRYYRFSGGLL